MDGQVLSLCSISFYFFYAKFSKVSGDLILQLRMSANTIVKHLNIFKRNRSGFGSGFKFLVVQALILQRAKEALHRRIMRALGFAQMPAALRKRLIRLMPTSTPVASRNSV